MKKTIVDLRLRQNVSTPDHKLYENFKKRAKKHSSNMYIDEGLTPSLFRIYRKGTLFDSTLEFLVERNSFKILLSNDGKSEIGFSIILKTENAEKKLLVVFKTGKAYYKDYKEEKN